MVSLIDTLTVGSPFYYTKVLQHLVRRLYERMTGNASGKAGEKMKIIYSPILKDARNEVRINQEDIDKICEKMITDLKNGLPKEAHSMEACEVILDECKKKLRENVTLKL